MSGLAISYGPGSGLPIIPRTNDGRIVIDDIRSMSPWMQLAVWLHWALLRLVGGKAERLAPADVELMSTARPETVLQLATALQEALLRIDVVGRGDHFEEAEFVLFEHGSMTLAGQFLPFGEFEPAPTSSGDEDAAAVVDGDAVAVAGTEGIGFHLEQSGHHRFVIGERCYTVDQLCEHGYLRQSEKVWLGYFAKMLHQVQMAADAGRDAVAEANLLPSPDEVEEAHAFAISVRTALFLRRVLNVLRGVDGLPGNLCPASDHEGLRRLMSAHGLFARALLHERDGEGRATAVDVANWAVNVAAAAHGLLWSFGFFVEFDRFTADVDAELGCARAKFPNNTLQLCALTEEVGEFADALYGDDADAVYKEAVQVAAMACRVGTEGDSTLPYDPSEVQWAEWVS